MYYGSSRAPSTEKRYMEPSPLRMLYFDDSAYSSAALETKLIAEFGNITRVKKDSHLDGIRNTKNGAIPSPFLVEFLGEKEYSLHYISNSDPNGIYTCLGNVCPLYAMDTGALLMSKLDRLMTNSPEAPLQITTTYQSGGAFIVDLFQDFIYFVIASIVINGLTEDREKGIKFGLFMTGVKRSSYYIGFLSVPLGISFLFCLMNFGFQVLSLSKNLIHEILLRKSYDQGH